MNNRNWKWLGWVLMVGAMGGGIAWTSVEAGEGAGAQSDAGTQDRKAAVSPERVAVFKSEIEKSCDAWEAANGERKSGFATREITNDARCELELGRDVAKAEAAALRGFHEQDMDPESKTYGTVPWTVGERAEREDANAIEFTCMPMGVILTRLRGKLTPGFLSAIEPHIRAGLTAIRRHKVSVAYTNIFLMKSANLLLLGEAMGDKEAVAEANGNLEEWIAYTKKNGIGEYNSPTYAEVQLTSATTAYNNTGNAEAKGKLKRILDYLWADVCGNYSGGLGQLGGAMSRSYDFVYGTGAMDRYFYMAGLLENPPGHSALDNEEGSYFAAVEGGYWPSEKIVGLGKLSRKVMTSGYGPEAGMDRTFYSTPEFSLGSASHPYGPQDRTIGFSFGTSKHLPLVEVDLDGFDMPDGSVRIKGKDGHSKPQHLQPMQSVVQEKGTLLGIFDLGSAVGNGEYKTLGLNVMLPAKADEIWVDGKRVEMGKTVDLECRADSVVVVREGKAVLMVRIFGLEGMGGTTPGFALKNDAAKGEVLRLVGYAYQGVERSLKGESGHAGVAMVAEACESDEAFKEFMKKVDGERLELKKSEGWWTAKYRGLEAGIDKTGKMLVRKVDGKDVEIRGTARVNGMDLGEWLGE